MFVLVNTNRFFPQGAVSILKSSMGNTKVNELEYLAHLGREKIKSLKAFYQLTDRELALLLKLHSKSNKKEEIYRTPLLKK